MYKSVVFGDEFVVHLKSHRGVQLGLDQSSSSTLTESSFLFDSCLIHQECSQKGDSGCASEKLGVPHLLSD